MSHTDTCCSAANDPPPSLRRAVDAFRREAFFALLAGTTPRFTEIADAASRDAIDVAPAIAWLHRRGALERDGARLIGAHGLTHRATPHSFSRGDRTIHTWCAFDAVGIPVVLGATTRVTTTCPTCSAPISIDVENGRLPERPALRLWLPARGRENLLADFCAHANLFCNRDHLTVWQDSNGESDGEVASLHEVPARALKVWSDIASPMGAESFSD
jgi:alkylmercury lyase